MMKNFVRCIALALACWLLLAGTALAADAARIDLAFDGVKMPDYAQLSSNYFMSGKGYKGGLSGYYLSAWPEMKNDTVFVPVRVISEVMGAKVSWLGETPGIGQSVLIEYQDEWIQLFTSDTLGHKGMQPLDLEQIPYAQDGSIYVPVRFVAEAFDCRVEWDAAQNLVNIRPPARQLNGQALCGVVHHVMATMENWDMRLDSPFFADKMYSALWEGLAGEVAAPQHTGRWPNLDIPDFYYLLTGYDFLLADNSAAASCEIYVHVPNQPMPDGYSEYLVHVDDKWYNLNDEAGALLTEWQELANWQRVD